MASKRVSKKASILDPIFKLFLTILEAPGGGGGASKWLPKSFQKRPWLQSYFDPRASILEPPGADFRGLARFIGSLAGSTFAAKRLPNKWWSAVLAEP